ncbi:hypothetical protein [uncultured Flavobacterium sp.]|uniref:hypothetical protein n=1 Tax=uncultured Flavobacterium sp. TaxID=165435 RepID=UPI0025CF731B|nr:hypothetical protein [uncultured Flavobacterium sp.]
MKNITIKKYTTLASTAPYDLLLEHLQASNSFAGRSMEIRKMPYSNVKYCIRLASGIASWDNVQQLFAICFDVDERAFWNARVTEYFPARKYLIKQLQAVVDGEAKQLSGTATDGHLWDLAGAGRLSPFSDTLPLVQLGRQLGQYPFDLGRKPYGEIMSLLVQVKVQNEVETEYQKLMQKR